jgi:hypothetical protein
VAISSPLNPSTIARERSTTAEAAQNFITGGSPLGEGVVASAANKIVGFQRGAAGVAARPPDLQGIIQTLSTSILNNVENRVQSINQNVTQIVNKSIGGLEQDYKDRLGKIDAAKPSSILQNFLNLYKEALGYIQFLGNRKNIRTLGDNLKSLQNVFTETFNIAKLIRQTIIKIVKQLSNLPAATGGGAGINLDLDIPGGSLRRGPLSGIGRMIRRRPGMVLGGAALAGGLGTQVVSGMMDIGGDVQAAPMSEGTIPTSLLDRFNSILDRFSTAINAFNTKKPRPTTASGGASPAPTKEGEKGAPGTPGAPGAPADFSGSANAEKSFNYFISQGYSKEQAAGIVGNLMQENRALDPNVANAIGHKGIAQWDPKIRYPALVKFSKERGLDPNTLEAQLQYFEHEMVTGSGGLSKKRFLAEAKTVEQSAVLMRKGFFRPGESEAMDANRIKFGQQVLSTYGGVAKQGKPGVEGKSGEKGTPGKPGVSTTQLTTSKVEPAPTPAATQQQIAQTVSQPPVQQTSQITVAPMNMASPQTQSTKVGDNAIPPPAMSKGGISVPFLSSSNNDNFLTLYSRIVYNIVDG